MCGVHVFRQVFTSWKSGTARSVKPTQSRNRYAKDRKGTAGRPAHEGHARWDTGSSVSEALEAATSLT